MTITPPPYKNKAFGLTATVLALSSVLGSASIAEAATFTFSFQNQDSPDYPVGTLVTGQFVVPDTALTIDSTYQATSLTITSAPSPLNTIFSGIDLVTGPVNVILNSFVFVSGMIDASASIFESALNSNAGTFIRLQFGGPTFLTDSLTNNTVIDGDGGTLMYSNAPITTPEPTSVISLIGIGVLGVASKLKKKA